MGRGVEGSLLGLIEYEEPREPRKAPPLPPEPEPDAGVEATPAGGLGLVIYRRPVHPREPVARPETPGPDIELFQELVASMPQKRRSWQGLWKSVAAHVVTIAAIVLVVVLRPLDPAPETRDYIRALIYDPPPPPPPPLPKGQALTPKLERAKPVTDNPEPEKPRVQEPVMEAPVEAEVKPEPRDAASEQFGSETGSDFGVPEGMEGGVEGGVVGGTLGGVLGGVLGGTGTGPVLDYDKPPRLLRQTKPVYPQEAFVKKIEGIVLVEILIDSTGRVARARVLQSIPSLDKAALQTVYQWIFSPAIKHGRPVPTIAHVPVGFRIY